MMGRYEIFPTRKKVNFLKYKQCEPIIFTSGILTNRITAKKKKP